MCQSYLPLGGPIVIPLGLFPQLRSQPGSAVLTLVLPPDLSSLTIWKGEGGKRRLVKSEEGEALKKGIVRLLGEAGTR